MPEQVKCLCMRWRPEPCHGQEIKSLSGDVVLDFIAGEFDPNRCAGVPGIV